MSGLAPPTQVAEDPGAHELAESSDEHFSDASEGHKRSSSSGSAPASPIPVTRVERVDDEPAHGEVPGTAAYSIRTQDAVPDQIEVVPEGSRSRSSSSVRDEERPTTPGGFSVPKTVVEKVEPDKPSHGEVPGTAAYEMRMADAEPDEILTSPQKAHQPLEGTFIYPGLPGQTLTAKGEPTLVHRSRSSSEGNGRSPSSPSLEQHNTPKAAFEEYDEELEEPWNTSKDGEGLAEPEIADQPAEDDFDDFEEGGEDDDFGDFDDGAQEPATPAPEPASYPPHDPLAHLPNLNFSDFETPEDILSSLDAHLQALFPDIDPQSSLSSAPIERPEPILSDRSASLWGQLVAPPPLQPPNWIKSRIRRLFLVSLGVPVDLDEILPASKQKKLILPSLESTDSPREPQQLSSLRPGNDSTVSLSSSTSKGAEGKSKDKDKKKKDNTGKRPGPPPPPDFDLVSAGQLCTITREALAGYEDAELRDYIQRLSDMTGIASSVLEYWISRKDSALGDKEAFEGVIENLVGHVRKSKGKR